MHYLEALVSTFCLGRKEGLSVAKNLRAKIEEQKVCVSSPSIPNNSVKVEQFLIPGHYE